MAQENNTRKIKTHTQNVKKIIKRNINVEVDEDLWYDLRKQALERKIEFHGYIRLVLQEAVE